MNVSSVKSQKPYIYIYVYIELLACEISADPPFYHPNIWPKDDVPDLEPAFKDLGELVIDVGIRLAKHCDQ